MNDKSMLEVAMELMSASSEAKNIYKLIDDVMEELGYGDDANAKAQLYIDITTSADFVFMGDDVWDLKSRQSLDLWDKSFYESEVEADMEDEDDEEDNLTMEDYNYVEDEEESLDEDEESLDDEDEDEDNSYEIDESEGDEDEEEGSWDEDEEDNSWDDEDEEKYNDMMDDYEDLYEDK